MTNIYPDPLQLLGHPRPAMAGRAQARLFLDMGQNDHVCALPAAGRAAANGPQATRADVHHLTQPFRWKAAAVFLNEPEPDGFWLAKNRGACLRMPLSSRSMRLSRRSRSLSSARWRSSCDTTSVSRCAVIHLFSVDIPAPRSSAICLRESPLACAMRTASRLNSSPCIAAVIGLLDGKYCLKRPERSRDGSKIALSATVLVKVGLLAKPSPVAKTGSGAG